MTVDYFRQWKCHRSEVTGRLI